MKKLFVYTLAMLLLLFTLTSCGSTVPERVSGSSGAMGAGVNAANAAPAAHEPSNSADAVAGDGSSENAQADEAETEFAFAFGDSLIKMDQDIAEVLEIMGEPLGVFEAPSCAFDGIDRIFSFPGVQIHTYPREDRDFVHTISLRDDSVSTVGGIYLGESPEAVFSAYGTFYEHEFDMFTYTRNMTTLSFLIEDDMVVAITYGLIMR